MSQRKLMAVIGASYGDEGKGTTVDFLCSESKNNPIVVRFNGGPQAGHTVVAEDGRRHVFSHFGSGSFRGIPTYLTKKFIVNPIAFLRELSELEDKFNLDPVVLVHESCPVTTPFEIMLNQAAETKRSGGRHGSCGMGIGETVERDYYFRLTVMDLYDEESLRKKLEYIRTTWVVVRMGDLGIGFDDMPNLFLDNVFESFVIDCKKFISRTIQVVSDLDVFDDYGDIIFEGAQGLRLDQDSEDFPHVTRSYTGLDNIIDFLGGVSLAGESLDIFYVTRTYLTRHGNGPMESEYACNPYGNFKDATNHTNTFQGHFRYGLISSHRLSQDIIGDVVKLHRLKHPPFPLPYKIHLMVTHVDQCGDKMRWDVGTGAVAIGPVGNFVDEISARIPLSTCYVSNGPTAKDKTKIFQRDLQLGKGNKENEQSNITRNSV